jgi:hypothetical protein
MLRPWRWTWPIAMAGPVLSFTNHVMSNQFTHDEFGLTALLNRASGQGVPWFYEMVRDVSAGGRLPMLVLVAGTVVVVIVESLILRSMRKRDQLFPDLPAGHVTHLLKNSLSMPGLAQLLAAERYVSLRRTIYYTAWIARRRETERGAVLDMGRALYQAATAAGMPITAQASQEPEPAALDGPPPYPPPISPA